MSFEEVKAILSFMYRGQCVVSQDQLPSLLSVAKLLKIQGLCDMKVRFNKKKITYTIAAIERVQIRIAQVCVETAES